MSAKALSCFYPQRIKVIPLSEPGAHRTFQQLIHLVGFTHTFSLQNLLRQLPHVRMQTAKSSPSLTSICFQQPNHTEKETPPVFSGAQPQLVLTEVNTLYLIEG